MFDIRHPTWKQGIALALLIVVGLMLSGWILADRLMPEQLDVLELRY